MANYKVVDADQLDTDLASVADAIRSKGDTSGQLAFPDGFVGAVNALELSGGGGGGLPNGVTTLASGTYTCATAPSSNFAIEHGLGVTPNFFVIYAEGESVAYTDFYYFTVAQFGLGQKHSISTNPNLGAFRILRYGSNNGFSHTASNGPLSSFATDVEFYVYNSATYQLKPGITYRWIAGVVAGI